MSKQLLFSATLLNDRIERLLHNKTKLNWCLSENVNARSSYLNFYPVNSLKDDTISIPLDAEEFKRVSFLLNEMNEKKLIAAQDEFDKIFNPNLSTQNREVV